MIVVDIDSIDKLLMRVGILNSFHIVLFGQNQGHRVLALRTSRSFFLVINSPIYDGIAFLGAHSVIRKVWMVAFSLLTASVLKNVRLGVDKIDT